MQIDIQTYGNCNYIHTGRYRPQGIERVGFGEQKVPLIRVSLVPMRTNAPQVLVRAQEDITFRDGQGDAHGFATDGVDGCYSEAPRASMGAISTRTSPRTKWISS